MGPLIAVAPTRYVVGWESPEQYTEATPEETPAELELIPLREALEREYQTDAHFFAFRTQPRADICFRFKKSALKVIREHGADIVCEILALDLDNPNHAAWAPGGWDAFCDKLFAAWELGFHAAGQWIALYPTRRGARLVYWLDRALPADIFETYYRGLVESFRAHGFRCDNLWDWPHEFRLPKVLRENDDGTREVTAVQPYFEPGIEWQHEARLPVDSITPVGEVEVALDSTPISFEIPSPEECQKILEISRSGKTSPTAWAREARKRLHRRGYYPFIYEGKSFPPGQRDPELRKTVSSVVGLLFPFGREGLQGTTPQHLYALLLEPTRALAQDAHEEGKALDKLQRFLSSAWGKEEARASLRQAEELDASALTMRVLHGMRKWCDEPTLHHESDAVAIEWMRQRLIICLSGTHYVMRRDGYFDSLGVAFPYVASRIRELDMTPLIPIETMNNNGIVPIAPRDIITKHGASVSTARGIPQQPGAYVERFGAANAELVVPLFSRRSDLEPTYNEWVDRWLKLFFGPLYERGCEWIAWALAFDEGPICALSINGPPGVGKKLIIRGLAECLDTGKVANGNDLVSEHGTGVLESCFLAINEGFPRTSSSSSPADAFRRVVSGEVEPVNPKFKTHIHIRNPLRVIIAANNLDTVSLLSGGKDLSPDDRAALAYRLFHVRVPRECANWLESLGGPEFTAAEGSRWIEGDAGEKSDYVVARHFLWLYSRRGKKPGRRFLVDGSRDADIMLELRLSGAALNVCETLIDMLNALDKGSKRFKGLAIEEEEIYGTKKLYVLCSEIMEFQRAKIGVAKADQFSSSQLNSALSGLRTCDPRKRALKSKAELGYQRWSEIDTALLLSVAENKLQKPCRLLSRLVDGGEITRLEGIPEQQSESESEPEPEGVSA